MNINFENLELLSDIHQILVQIRNEKMNSYQKKWMTTEELANYIAYSKESIKKMIKEEELLLGKHFYKIGKKKLFDKIAIDSWIMGTEIVCSNNSDFVVDEILNDII